MNCCTVSCFWGLCGFTTVLAENTMSVHSSGVLHCNQCSLCLQELYAC